MTTIKLECQQCDWHYDLSPATPTTPLNDELALATALYVVHVILVHPDIVEMIKARADEFSKAINTANGG